MLSLDDKEFVRAFIRLMPEVLGSRLRAVKTGIRLRRLLERAKDADPIQTDLASVRSNTLGLAQEGIEMTPDEVRQVSELFNFAIEAAGE